MAIRDSYHNNLGTLLLSPQTLSADTNTTGVSIAAVKELEIAALVGTCGNATLHSTIYISLELEESADNVTYTDVAEADMLGAVSGTTTGQFAKIDAKTKDDTAYACGYRGNKKYVRAVVNFVGSHGTGTPIGIASLGSRGRHNPLV